MEENNEKADCKSLFKKAPVISFSFFALVPKRFDPA